MKFYEIKNNANYSFDITVNNETININSRYIPENGWTLSTDFVAGIKATPYLPIFRQYGYPNILPWAENDPIGRNDKFYLAVLTDDEVEQSNGLPIFNGNRPEGI